jgi:hypothetical protein
MLGKQVEKTNQLVHQKLNHLKLVTTIHHKVYNVIVSGELKLKR